MTKELDILIDGVELYCLVDFSVLNDEGFEIEINTVTVKGIEVMDLITPENLEKVRYSCELHYYHQQYLWMRERDDAREL